MIACSSSLLSVPAMVFLRRPRGFLWRPPRRRTAPSASTWTWISERLKLVIRSNARPETSTATSSGGNRNATVWICSSGEGRRWSVPESTLSSSTPTSAVPATEEVAIRLVQSGVTVMSPKASSDVQRRRSLTAAGWNKTKRKTITSISGYENRPVSCPVIILNEILQSADKINSVYSLTLPGLPFCSLLTKLSLHIHQL